MRRVNFSDSFIIVFMLVFIGIKTSPAQEASNQTADTEQQSAVMDSLAASDNVTLDFKEADIRNVLKIISYKSGHVLDCQMMAKLYQLNLMRKMPSSEDAGSHDTTQHLQPPVGPSIH